MPDMTSNSNLKLLGVVLLTAIITTLVCLGGAALYFQQQTGAVTQQSASIPPSDLAGSVENAGQNCMKTYANSDYPDFHFQYDKCQRSLREAVWMTETDIDNSTIKIIAETGIFFNPNEIDIEPQLLITLRTDIFPPEEVECYSYAFTPLNDNVGYLEKLPNNEFEYLIANKFYLRGTAEYEELRDRLGIDKVPSTATVCTEGKAKAKTIFSYEPYKEVFDKTGNFPAYIAVRANVRHKSDLEILGYNDIIKSIVY